MIDPRDPRFPPVAYDANRQPFNVPQFVPPFPINNLPVAKGRSSVPGAGGIVETRDDHRYATITEFNIAVGTTSIKVLDSPTGLRNLLMFRNASASDTLYIGFGKEATTASTLAITAGQLVLFDAVVPQDEVWCLSAGASGSLSVAYSTIPEV